MVMPFLPLIGMGIGWIFTEMGRQPWIVAGVMTALYSPLPYFGSLILTELWTAFAATAAILVCLRAAQRQQLRDYIIAGALFTATTLVRPAFVLMPFFFAMPMRSTTPISPITENSKPESHNSATAPMPAEGNVDRMVSGWTKLSYRMPRMM